jgi:NhaP-type Na+/H+ or K+/H+ antiporter
MPPTQASERILDSVWARLRSELRHVRKLGRRIAHTLDLLVLGSTFLVLALSAATREQVLAAVAVLLTALVVVRQLVTVRQVLEIDRARRKSKARFGWLVNSARDSSSRGRWSRRPGRR